MKNRVEQEKKFWDGYATRYDGFIRKIASGTYENLFEKLLTDTSGTGNLLEIATGTGIIALKLSSHISNITAIDLSPEMIKVAKQKCSQQNKKNIEFRTGDACNLEFPDTSFDVIIASNLLHLLFMPDLAMQEMKRVLKDGGKIILPTYLHGANLISHILSRLMGLSGFKVNNRWSVTTFREFVTSNGFRITSEKVIPDKIPLIYLVAKKQ